METLYIVIGIAVLLLLALIWMYKVDKEEDLYLVECVNAKDKCNADKNTCNSQLSALQKQNELWTATRNYLSTYNLMTTTIGQMQRLGSANSVREAYRAQQSAVLASMLSAIQAKVTELGMSNSDLYDKGFMPLGLA